MHFYPFYVKLIEDTTATKIGSVRGLASLILSGVGQGKSGLVLGHNTRMSIARVDTGARLSMLDVG